MPYIGQMEKGYNPDSHPRTPHTQQKREDYLPLECKLRSWSKARPDFSKLTLQTFGNWATGSGCNKEHVTGQILKQSILNLQNKNQ